MDEKNIMVFAKIDSGASLNKVDPAPILADLENIASIDVLSDDEYFQKCCDAAWADLRKKVPLGSEVSSGGEYLV